MDRIDASRTALVLVDYQARLLPAMGGGANVLAHALLLADAAALLGVTIVGTEQNPAGLGPNVDVIRERCARTLAKTHFDACEDGLLDALGAVPEVVIAGCEAHVCLLQTALGLRRAGKALWVVAPACGSRDAADHALAMQRLRDGGATIVGTEMVVFEWLHDCRHPRFREVLARLKARPAAPTPPAVSAPRHDARVRQRPASAATTMAATRRGASAPDPVPDDTPIDPRRRMP
ncbi:MAG: isochorismatase family protein [Burkholderiales bacterium]|nr:isochorismatase family protein [Burkholderiales bacterium]